MQHARCVVQHSVVAPSGDSEGTPLTILEAGATGLPVVSTRHAGIPDVVIEGATGFLVDEHDEESMAQHMIRLAQDPDLAGVMGRAARAHIQKNFSKARRLASLWAIIESCINRSARAY
jgi:glycosyltransferase involved in cell wall biosynthesis